MPAGSIGRSSRSSLTRVSAVSIARAGQVMIQELQNLRSQMRMHPARIASGGVRRAFSDGYHFELESGATKVKRFHDKPIINVAKAAVC